MTDPDWTNVPDPIAKEVSRLGEVRVLALMTVSLATVQRAMTFASITATATTATLGAAIASASGSPTFVGLTWPALVAAGMFWLSCILSIIPARPLSFHVPGQHPKLLYTDPEYIRGPLAQSHGWDAENYQRAIEENEACLKRNGRLMTAAILVAALAPAFAFVTWKALAGS